MNNFYIEYTTLQLYNISMAIQERLEKLNKLLQKTPVVHLLNVFKQTLSCIKANFKT